MQNLINNDSDVNVYGKWGGGFLLRLYGVVNVCDLDCIFLVSLTKSQTIEHKVAYMLYKLKRIS